MKTGNHPGGPVRRWPLVLAAGRVVLVWPRCCWECGKLVKDCKCR